MNFQDLLEKLFVETGYPDPNADRSDSLLQQMKDGLNETQDEISALCVPSLFHLIREKQILVASGTSDYLIDDWCQRPLSMWVEGTFAQRINFRRALSADRDGSRNSTLTPYAFGPFQVALLPRTNVPALKGASGAATGATAIDASSTVTFGASVTALSDAVIGRMIRLNGEQGDYLIVARTSNTVTTDRPIISRIRGLGITNVGAGYTNVRWEIGPVGRFQYRYLPSPNAAMTTFVRYMAYPRKMLEMSDTPEIQEDMHHLLWKGALRKIGASKQNNAMFTMYKQEFNDALQELRMSDDDDYESNDGPEVSRLGRDGYSPSDGGCGDGYRSSPCVGSAYTQVIQMIGTSNALLVTKTANYPIQGSDNGTQFKGNFNFTLPSATGPKADGTRFAVGFMGAHTATPQNADSIQVGSQVGAAGVSVTSANAGIAYWLTDSAPGQWTYERGNGVFPTLNQ